jgi:HrpA-like RNA helicase
MFYKKMSEKKKDDEFKKRLTVKLEPSRQERITNMLQSIANTNEFGSKKVKMEDITESEFKQRFLKNLEGNIRSNSQLPGLVFDQMVQDTELDEKLKKEHERKKNCDFAFMKMQQERAKLPAAEKCEEVVEAVKKNQVIVISGETGEQYYMMLVQRSFIE